MIAAIFAISSGLAFATKNAEEGNATAKQATGSQQQSHATAEYKRAKKRITAGYLSDKSVCSSKKGNAKTRCLKQAQSLKKHAMADAGKANRKAQAAGEH